MYKISNYISKKFSILSKDKNLIHLNKKFASNFFFKMPIVHGINVVLIALKKYFNLQKKNFFIDKIIINYKNFIYLNEQFEIKVFKKKILIFNKLNQKIEILIKKKNYKNQLLSRNFIKSQFKKHLLSISKIIGSQKPGNGAIIHKIESEYTKKFFTQKKNFNKISNNIWSLNYFDEFYKSNIITSKAKPYYKNKQIIKISKIIKKKISKKKILIIGPTGDIANSLIKSLKKTKCLLFFYSFKINEIFPVFSKKEKKKIIKFLLKTKPDYIFHLSSPRIYQDNNNNKTLSKLYKIIYCDFLIILLNSLLKFRLTSKIFYPSSIALNQPNKYKYLSSYIYAKQKGEAICKSRKYKKFIKYFRLPQFKTRSNYNLLGFYEGQNLLKFSKYLEIFFK